MLLKRKLTEVAIDSVADYLREKLATLKELDLDKDGQKDVEQMLEIVVRLSQKAKEALEATDFPKLASGLEQLMEGARLIGSSIDSEKLKDAGSELIAGLTKLGQLSQLGIRELKKID